MTIRFIADIGSNHNEDFGRVEKIMASAKAAGCWGVKFQLFSPDLLYRDYSPEQFYELYKRTLLRDWIPRLCDAAHMMQLGIGFTPFDLNAVKRMAEHRDKIDFVKIGSYELLWHELIRQAAGLKLPIILSTGMGTEKEINQAIGCVRQMEITDQILLTTDLTLLHCNSTYPADPKDCHLRYMRELNEQYIARIGWSDHTTKPGVIFAALAMDAETIEFHLDLDGAGWEFSHGHCWLPYEIAPIIRQSKDFMDALTLTPSSEYQDKLQKLRQKRTDPIDGLRPMKEVIK